MLPKINPMTTNAWEKLEDHYFSFEGTHMKELFEKDSNRFQNYSLKFEDIFVDFSKNIVDDKARELLLDLAGECKLKAAIESMFWVKKLMPPKTGPCYMWLCATGAMHPFWLTAKMLCPRSMQCSIK
jgi:hypothetical protein